MERGWLELESDPGLFTLLLEDFGVKGVQVEEIYDLQKSLEGPVYGFIFLFKWIEERRSRRKVTQEEESFVMEENVVNEMFFAKQVIPNSCATHSLLSVLLNCNNIQLGNTLTTLKTFTKHMNAEDKGFAIGNIHDLSRAHNSHARRDPYSLPEKQQGISAVRTAEAFHFVSYVPVNGRLFELDGLKPYPIDHGPWGDQEDWTEKFRRVISERLGMATGGEPYHDIRFNLMAVVPDRRTQYEQKLNTLKTNRHIILETLQQMVKVTGPVTDSAMEKETPFKPKTEPIMTRSVAKETAATKQSDGIQSTSGTQPTWRSARLKEKRERAATGLQPVLVEALPSAQDGLESHQLHSVLDNHNYAKSLEGVIAFQSHDLQQLTSCHSGGSYGNILESDDMKPDPDDLHLNQINTHKLQTVKDNDVKIQIAVSDEKEGMITLPATVANTDVTKPLTIQTKFTTCSSGPGSESTDTASEVGSCFNSPICSTTTSEQSSPNGPFGVSKVKTQTSSNPGRDTCFNMKLAERLKHAVKPEPLLENYGLSENEAALLQGDKMQVDLGSIKKENVSADESEHPHHHTGSPERKNYFGNHQGFTPKDLLALFKNVENEIVTCENNLREELEKRKKYRIDDCRRTHNYDQFICTFLSMLAEQGQLASLVEEHLKRRPTVKPGKLHGVKKPERRRRSRAKRRR